MKGMLFQHGGRCECTEVCVCVCSQCELHTHQHRWFVLSVSQKCPTKWSPDHNRPMNTTTILALILFLLPSHHKSKTRFSSKFISIATCTQWCVQCTCTSSPPSPIIVIWNHFKLLAYEYAFVYRTHAHTHTLGSHGKHPLYNVHW